MADIYRHEYQRAFTGDFTRWQDVHEEAKRIDLTVFQTVYAKEEGPEGFQSVPPAVQQAIEKSGVAPEHLMVSILAFWQKAPLYFPTTFPAAGRTPMRQLLRSSRRLPTFAPWAWSR